MVLVDTSAIIDLLKGVENEPAKLFHRILENRIDYGISILTYQEVLQGARDENEEMQLQSYLGTQRIYMLPDSLSFYDEVSRYRRLLRQRGVTIRNTIDILIAMTAVWYGLKLLYDDRDFGYLVGEIEGLEEYSHFS